MLKKMSCLGDNYIGGSKMRRMLYMYEKEDELKGYELKKSVEDIVNLLVEYLKDYEPKTYALTKHTIMGPVGKLLHLLGSERFRDLNAIVGYIINIHKNTSRSEFVSKETMEKLTTAVNALLNLKQKVSTRNWLRIINEVDYAVYKKAFENIITRIEQKKTEKEAKSEG